jgi:outer membrane protein assembly factor BamB
VIRGWIAGAVIAAAPALELQVAVAGTVTGTVYIDIDDSGSLSPGDRAIEGAAVYWETSRQAFTDAAGAFTIEAPDRAGMVWVRAPDGMSPAPVWSTAAADGQVIDLGLRPAAENRRPGFVQASDTHTGKRETGIDRLFSAADMMDAFAQAIDPDRPPMFVVVTGDVATGARVEHYEAIRDATSGMQVPFVPVPGNHDWYDNGANYRAHMGPPMYSFEAGGARFVVLNDNGDTAAWESFLAMDLTDADPGAPVVAFIHQPPRDAGLGVLAAAGVDHLFSGHWHSNMVIEHEGLVQYNTQPLYSGGIDTTPGGYRVVDLIDGGLEVRHHSVVSRGHARIVHPLGATCGVGDQLEILAAVELGAGEIEVTATVDGREVAMEPAGGWVWRATTDRPGVSSTIAIRARRGIEEVTDRTVYEPVACDAPETLGEWRQFQGNPANTGFTDREIEPPLINLWAAPVGGHVHGGSPVIADGRVFVSVSDFGGGTTGALVALDLLSGRELWRRTTGTSVRNAAAVSGEVVVVGRADGVVEGLEAATGELRWSVDLGAGLERNFGVLHAAPTVSDGVAYIGVHRRFAAIDTETGEIRWELDPATSTTLTSMAAAAVRGDEVTATVARGRQGMFTLSRDDGSERWRTSARTAVGVHASPVLGGAVVYVANARGEVIAMDIETGEARWTSNVVTTGEWDYAIVGTPALSRGKLFVPTQYDRLGALDVGNGSLVWSIEVDEAPIRTAHTRTVARSIGASPVVTGDVLWLAGADGVLRAVDPDTGDQLWQLDLGSPVTAGLAPAGQILVVATFDGTVRALVKYGELPPTGGCGCGASPEGGAVVLLVAMVWIYRRRRLTPVADSR